MKPCSGVLAWVIAFALLFATGATKAAPGGSVTFVKKLLPDLDAAQDQFGGRVAVDGDRLAVGAYLDDDKGQDAGAVYIFERNRGGAGAWGLAKKITAPNGAAGDFFGETLVLEGGRLAVGATLRQGVAGRWRGSTYLFEVDAGGKDSWGLVKELTPATDAAEERFGYHLALEDDVLAVGALGHRAAGTQTGAVYLFRKDRGGAGNWGLAQTLLAEVSGSDPDFGSAIALRGSRLLVGARGTNEHRGAAFLFAAGDPARDSWTQVKKFAVNGAVDDYFGWSVALEGDLIAVGAAREGTPELRSGAVHLFARDQGGPDGWGQVKRLISVPDSQPVQLFGHTLSLQGQLLAVSAVWDSSRGYRSGSAYLYARDEGGAASWGLVSKFTAPDNVAEDWFAQDLGLDGATLLVGAAFDDDHGPTSGSASLFRLDVGTGCATMPCLNGGLCSGLGGTTVVCACAAGFSGDRCQSSTADPVPDAGAEVAPSDVATEAAPEVPAEDAGVDAAADDPADTGSDAGVDAGADDPADVRVEAAAADTGGDAGVDPDAAGCSCRVGARGPGALPLVWVGLAMLYRRARRRSGSAR